MHYAREGLAYHDAPTLYFPRRGEGPPRAIPNYPPSGRGSAEEPWDGFGQAKGHYAVLQYLTCD